MESMMTETVSSSGQSETAATTQNERMAEKHSTMDGQQCITAFVLP